MGARRRAHRLGGGLAAVAAGTTLFALLASGGCELVVNDTVPAFTCMPGAQTCPGGQVCLPSTHKCVSQAGLCTPGAASGCPGGMRCDDQTLRCATSPATGPDASGGADVVAEMPPEAAPEAMPVVTDATSADAPVDAREASVLDAPADAPVMCRGITCGCRGPADCDSGVCADTLTATTALSNALSGMNFCTQPCCSSTDCPGNTVCFGTGGGGNYCVAPTWIGRAADQTPVVGGTPCTDSTQCRSGLCNMATMQCADTCCSTTQQISACAAGTVCRYAAFPGAGFDTHETAWCGAAIGTTAGGSPCAVDANCQSGKCGTLARCEAVCRSTTDCGTMACSYGLGPTTLPSNKDIVAGCVNVTGTTANGGACSTNADCESAFCDGTKCTDVCVTDGDCKGGLHCRPVVVQVQGSYSVLCCES